MTEKEQPPAPPAEADTSAPATPAIAPEDGKKIDNTVFAVAHVDVDPALAGEPLALAAGVTTVALTEEPAAAAEPKKPEPTVYELVRHHARAGHNHPHPTVHEFAELQGLSKVMVFNPATKQHEQHDCWQVKALFARFHGHGLHEHARVPHEVLERALHEALHGRV